MYTGIALIDRSLQAVLEYIGWTAPAETAVATVTKATAEEAATPIATAPKKTPRKSRSTKKKFPAPLASAPIKVADSDPTSDEPDIDALRRLVHRKHNKPLSMATPPLIIDKAAAPLPTKKTAHTAAQAALMLAPAIPPATTKRPTSPSSDGSDPKSPGIVAATTLAPRRVAAVASLARAPAPTPVPVHPILSTAPTALESHIQILKEKIGPYVKASFERKWAAFKHNPIRDAAWNFNAFLCQFAETPSLSPVIKNLLAQYYFLPLPPVTPAASWSYTDILKADQREVLQNIFIAGTANLNRQDAADCDLVSFSDKPISIFYAEACTALAITPLPLHVRHNQIMFEHAIADGAPLSVELTCYGQTANPVHQAGLRRINVGCTFVCPYTRRAIVPHTVMKSLLTHTLTYIHDPSLPALTAVDITYILKHIQRFSKQGWRIDINSFPTEIQGICLAKWGEHQKPYFTITPLGTLDFIRDKSIPLQTDDKTYILYCMADYARRGCPPNFASLPNDIRKDCFTTWRNAHPFSSVLPHALPESFAFMPSLTSRPSKAPVYGGSVTTTAAGGAGAPAYF